MSRTARLLVTAAAVCAGLLALDGLAWWLLTDRMEAELAAWQQARRQEGFVVIAGPVRRGGWPFEAVLVVPGVTLATGQPGQPDTITWQTDQVRIAYAPWHPATLDVTVEGPQAVRFGSASPMTLATSPLDAHIPLDSSGQAQGVAIRTEDVTIPTAGGPVHIGSLAIRLRQADIFVSASGASLPGRTLPFGGTVQALDFHARATGAIPFLGDPQAALAAWRNSGQRLLVDGLTLQWGPLDVRGNASIGLDAALQPEGSASVQLTGYAEVTDALARSGAITRADARVATTLLGLMARPGAGNVVEADLPVTLKDRTLSIGAIPLLRVPALPAL